MTKNFINRVLRDGKVDTAKYRYITFYVNDGNEQHQVIKRILISALDTTAALADANANNPRGWVTIYSR